MFKTNHQKGVSLYIATIIMLILLAIALGVSTILFGQIKMIKRMGDSVRAFYGADTGAEWLAYQKKQGINILANCPYQGEEGLKNSGCTETFGDVTYYVDVRNPGTDNCPSDALYYCVRSQGSYKQTDRAIELTY